ncbi:MAG: DUF327 family protein [Synergistales bacterium]|nr:DUF327 family protein [Synergistales bacterium]
MKVEGAGGRQPRKGEISRGRRHASLSPQKSDPPPSFDEAFDALELDRLFRKLEEISARLGRYPSRTLLLEYRVIVGELLRREARASRLREDYRWRRATRTRFILVERVEEALGEIEAVLEREGERVTLLKLMEEVKGCLISLLL